MKNKKLLVAILAISLSASCLPMLGNVRANADELTAADEYFLDFVATDIGNAAIEYESSPLYDETLTVNGYEYTFQTQGANGFALIHEVQIGEAVFYEVEELSYNGVSPFENSVGLPVFITFRLYLDYINGAFYDLTTGAAVETEALAAASEKGFGYNGGGTFVEDSYTITYDHKDTSEVYWMEHGFPDYCPTTGTSCAQAAGAGIIGYYDQYCENLIPDFQSYRLFGTSFFYKSATLEIGDLMVELATLMGGGDSGTTFAGFQAGMSSYAQNQGYTYTSTSLFSGGVLDYNAYKTSVQNGKPVALFLDGYAIGAVQEGDGVDTVNSSVSQNTHVAVGFGYKTHYYYDANNNLISTQKYFKVASGLSTYGLCYLNMNAYGTINHAISIEIA